MSESEVSLIQEGAGEDLVLLHGYLSCKESFYWQIKYFSKYFRVTAFDFWGFGKSPPLTEPWSVDDYAAHTLALLDELHIGRAHLLTHSFGGRVGLKLLAAHGERFLKAVFTGCAGIPPKRGISYRAKVFSYRAVRKIAPRYAEKHFGSAEYRTLSPVMRESYKKIVNEDLTPCLKDVRNPVLFVFGQQDTATPLYMGKILSEGVRDGALVTMRGTHFCFSEDPDSFNRIAGEFLR
ncbi:alpha/beta hydrolase [Candidatus Borkfalkia ceftriaxoniphila]|uniref:Alpha/beta hydrolase n=1 Tax=Candidatus Borkfalkia ceftriaxoniphila TaxID=2508949 RepID=A0A4Q2KF38_9FIRM|nr:alpha/beta hydrolase [Candidatus Borkfalkia ceftriaxoniphila]RXZ61913.1 alpha/beta hydrolase [Candidatus Borkfalkia ceftriaxoniphila]